MRRPFRGIEYKVAQGGDPGRIVEAATGEQVMILPGDEIEFTYIQSSDPIPRGGFVKPEGEGCELITWYTWGRLNFVDLPPGTRFHFIHLAEKPRWRRAIVPHRDTPRPWWFRLEGDVFSILELDGDRPGIHRHESRRGPWSYIPLAEISSQDLPWEVVAK